MICMRDDIIYGYATPIAYIFKHVHFCSCVTKNSFKGFQQIFNIDEIIDTIID